MGRLMVQVAERQFDGPSGSVGARIRGVATHLPDAILTNDALATLYPDWPAERIFDKTGIRERRIAAADETASDLAFVAATKLFDTGACTRDEVDFLILCTQAPDYVLPTTACILQNRLGLSRHVGALDINLGCSGFVYGLSLAVGLIASGAAINVLLLTADTYSKLLHADDKSVRTLFGDAAAAVLISRDAEGDIGPFVFGTDGSGADDLIVKGRGFRTPGSDHAFSDARSASDLHMHGGNIMSFTLREIPTCLKALLAKADIAPAEIDHLVLHQANKLVLDSLQKKMNVDPARIPRFMEFCGNTISSSIPLVIDDLLRRDVLRRGHRMVLLGFGVGLSWAAVTLRW
jgi:3-oxoacyl-[acyl-carrier-protein] synthase-3